MNCCKLVEVIAGEVVPKRGSAGEEGGGMAIDTEGREGNAERVMSRI